MSSCLYWNGGSTSSDVERNVVISKGVRSCDTAGHKTLPQQGNVSERNHSQPPRPPLHSQPLVIPPYWLFFPPTYPAFASTYHSPFVVVDFLFRGFHVVFFFGRGNLERLS